MIAGGELWPDEIHKFSWKLVYAQVWWFWVDVVGADAKFEIVRDYSAKVNGVYRAYVWVKNIGADHGFYNVYVATAWPIDS